MTANELANDMLAHIGKQVGDAGIPDGALGKLVRCINGAQKLMRSQAPAMFKQPIPAAFSGSFTGTVSVTNSSESIYLGTLATPQSGATIRIPGDNVDNEIYDVHSEAGDLRLKFPFGGETGEVTATAWRDSVVLDAPVDKLLGNAMHADGTPLVILNSRAEFQQYDARFFGGDYGTSGSAQASSRRQRFEGKPQAIWLEAFTHFELDEIQYRLHCTPLPSGDWPINVDAQIKPALVTEDDLAEDAVFEFAVPGGCDESILSPIAMQLWMSAPWVRAEAETRRAIAAEFNAAMEQLENFRGDLAASGRVIVQGW